MRHYTRTVEFGDIAASSELSWLRRATQNAAHPRESWSDTEVLSAACWLLPHPFSLHITVHVTNVEGIPLANLVRKNNTLHHYPHPLPSLESVTPRSNMITAAHVKYSNCIRYNFFIFCPICMQFSHNILHTYSFI